MRVFPLQQGEVGWDGVGQVVPTARVAAPHLLVVGGGQHQRVSHQALRGELLPAWAEGW